MNNNYLLLLLPFTILLFGILAGYSYFMENWSLPVTMYLALICGVAIYTAGQSIFIQTSLIWEIDDLKPSEKNELIVSITKDFVVYLCIHGIIATVIYMVLYWIVMWF
jgi:hypothetical protein